MESQGVSLNPHAVELTGTARADWIGLIYILNFILRACMKVHVYHIHTCSAQGGQNKSLDLLELELQTNMSCHCHVGAQT